MINNISLKEQSSLRIESDKIIYFDPFKLDNNNINDADYIFITHPHYDHFSISDIEKIKKTTTKIIAPYELEEEIKNIGFIKDNILLVKPNLEYNLDNINFSTVHAYNINKDFHKKESNWVGYIINILNKKIYIAGDTDNIEELKNINCDIACVPIGGTYTMNALEAVQLIKEIKPDIAIPIHYKTIVGSVEDAYKFKELLEPEIKVEILMK